MRIAIPELQRFCTAALLGAGVSPADADLTASLLVQADSWGVFTHGVKNLRGYLRRVAAGGIRAEGQPRVAAQGPAWTLVDGDQALGTVASAFAMRAAIDRARQAGIGYAGLRNSCHFGAAGVYALMAAEAGMIGLAMSNDTPTVTAPGARGPVLGSNPLAFSAPVAGEMPLVLDLATSTVAGGKVFSAAAQRQPIPLGWVVDAQGQPTTDATLWPAAGALTPMAGHKGYGLALMIETLSAVVSGAPMLGQVLSWSFADPSLPTGHSAAFIAIDVAVMPGGADFAERMARLVSEVRGMPRASGIERILIPGEREWTHQRQALADGLDMPPDVARVLLELAVETDLNALLPADWANS